MKGKRKMWNTETTCKFGLLLVALLAVAGRDKTAREKGSSTEVEEARNKLARVKAVLG